MWITFRFGENAEKIGESGELGREKSERGENEGEVRGENERGIVIIIVVIIVVIMIKEYKE